MEYHQVLIKFIDLENNEVIVDFNRIEKTITNRHLYLENDKLPNSKGQVWHTLALALVYQMTRKRTMPTINGYRLYSSYRFLGGMFLTYGTDVLSFTETNQEERTDPMIVIFPRVTKCSFHTYGPSGTVEIHDLMCVLALNIINEKIYVIMWFWFIVLTVISITAFIYRLLMFYVPVIRSTLLFQKPASMLHYKKVLDQNVSKKLQIGDLFLIYLLSKNMEMLSFDSLLEELFLRLNDQHIYLPDHDQSNTYKERDVFEMINSKNDSKVDLQINASPVSQNNLLDMSNKNKFLFNENNQN
nr:innexin inx3-like [Penaeus vannamei]